MNPDRFLGSSRYRHPGDVIRLIAGGLVLIGALAVAVIAVRGPWLADTMSARPAILAAAAALVVAGSAWQSQPWRRAAWSVLFGAGVALLVVSAMPPAALVLALAAGVTAGAAALVAFGAPDHRIGPGGIAAALRSAGLPAGSVLPADVETKGSRPFVAVTDAGQRLFIKAIGADQRDADLLFRAYRFARLRDVDDTWPTTSVVQAVEHQALAGITAERADVDVPRVERVIRAADGTALLVMERVDGCSLEQTPPAQITDKLLHGLWTQVDRLHRPGSRIVACGRRTSWSTAPAGPGSPTSAFPTLPPRSANGTSTWRSLSPRCRYWSARTGQGQAPRRSSASRESPRRFPCCSRWPSRPPPAALSPIVTACWRGLVMQPRPRGE